EVVGALHHAVFPEMCVRCGWPPQRTLPVTRLFRRTSDDSSRYVVASVSAPFCAACIQAHESEVRPVDRDVRRRLLRKWLVEALPYLFPLGANLWFLTIFVPKLLASLAEPGDLVETLVWGGVSAFFGLLALAFFRMAMAPGRSLIVDPADPSRGSYVQVERGPLGSRFIVPTEPTTALRALRFSDDRSEAFDAERHRFTFENAEVGAKFAELNAHREWNPDSPRARTAAALRWSIVGAVVLAVLWQLLRDLLG
ncbi:MAG TPA: hypothetical protein VF263_19750, partial [Longimicrobiaceae bacterium]